ncbi:MAG TPA: hypothetical protein VGT05_04830 [Patescibacteria group bacterium]|nr:hypothetical protein [Patescibacteria group bacterium]
MLTVEEIRNDEALRALLGQSPVYDDENFVERRYWSGRFINSYSPTGKIPVFYAAYETRRKDAILDLDILKQINDMDVSKDQVFSFPGVVVTLKGQDNQQESVTLLPVPKDKRDKWGIWVLSFTQRPGYFFAVRHSAPIVNKQYWQPVGDVLLVDKQHPEGVTVRAHQSLSIGIVDSIVALSRNNAQSTAPFLEA